MTALDRCASRAYDWRGCGSCNVPPRSMPRAPRARSVTVRGTVASYSWSTARAGSAPNSLTMTGHNPFRDPTLGERIVALVLAAWLLMTTYAFVALRRRWRAGGGLALPLSIVKRFRRTPKRWRIGALACATLALLLWSSRFLWPQERGLWRDN